MKSFISDNILNIIDFHCVRLDKSQSQRCTSITGGELNIVGSIFTRVTFHRCKHKYHSSFLVSSNIPYDCVLGWHFLTQHKLSIQGSILGGRSNYQLVGTFGKCPVQSEHPANRVHSNGVVITEVDLRDVFPQNSSGTSAVLAQSQLRGVNKVTLTEGVTIPARSEIIIEGRVRSKDVPQFGMISASQSESVQHLKGLHVAHLVVRPIGRTVPVRIANTTEHEIELQKSCKLAEFCPLIEQTVVANNKFPVHCHAVKAAALSQQIDSSLDPNLSKSEKQQLKRVLHEFEAVFSDKIGHTDIVHHSIDSGNNPPIKQRARRIPYAFREESDKRITDMLDQGIISPSTSPWASPVVLVRKKSGNLRFCRVDDLLDSVGHAKYFTTLDLKSGYHQISVHPDDREKTAFVTHTAYTSLTACRLVSQLLLRHFIQPWNSF